MDNNFEVLIVEDSEEMLWATANVLENAGFTVEGVTNGRDALDMVNRFPSVQLILLNYFLPDQLGVSVFREIQSDGCQARVIGISAFQDAREAFLNAGAFAFLEKPFDIKELVSLCRQAINGGEPDGMACLGNITQGEEVKTYGNGKINGIFEPRRGSGQDS